MPRRYSLIVQMYGTVDGAQGLISGSISECKSQSVDRAELCLDVGDVAFVGLFCPKEEWSVWVVTDSAGGGFAGGFDGQDLLGESDIGNVVESSSAVGWVYFGKFSGNMVKCLEPLGCYVEINCQFRSRCDGGHQLAFKRVSMTPTKIPQKF